MTVTAYSLCGVKAVGVDPVFFIILLFYKKKKRKDKSSKACDFTVDASCSQTSSAVAAEGISMWQTKRNPLTKLSQHNPSVCFLLLIQFRVVGEGEAYPSCHGARGGVHPGQALNSFTVLTHKDRQLFTPTVDLESPINQTHVCC